MSCKDHVDGAVCDAIAGIGEELIKELEHVSVCVFGG